MLGEEPDVGAEFSSRVERYWEEGRLPPPDAPILLPALSRRACAPKLTRRAKDGEAGVFNGTCMVASSSITAGSSPKLFRNSGEPEPFEVEMLARRCLANALYGEVLLLPPRPSVVIDMLRFCGGAGTEAGTEVEIGAVGTEEAVLRGLNSSAKDERRLCGPEASGDGGDDWSAMAKDWGQPKCRTGGLSRSLSQGVWCRRRFRVGRYRDGSRAQV